MTTLPCPPRAGRIQRGHGIPFFPGPAPRLRGLAQWRGSQGSWRLRFPNTSPGVQSGTARLSSPKSGGAGRKLPGVQSGAGGAGRKLPGVQSGAGGAGRKLPGVQSGAGGAGRKLPGAACAPSTYSTRMTTAASIFAHVREQGKRCLMSNRVRLIVVA